MSSTGVKPKCRVNYFALSPRENNLLGKWVASSTLVHSLYGLFLLSVLLLFFFACFLLFRYSCLCFPTTTFHPTPPYPPASPTLNPYPLWPCPWVLYTWFLTTLPHFFPCYPPSPSPLVSVSLFLISMSLVICCVLDCFID